MKIDNLIEGMQIISKYSTDRFCVHAEHDQIYCGHVDLPLTDEEKDRMKELGWFNEYDSWSAWV